ncbi:MAG: RluA family pseudouridine synthase [Phycisphaerales bacterium]
MPRKKNTSSARPADSFESGSKVVRRGGKVDPDALRHRVAAHSPTPARPNPAAASDGPAPAAAPDEGLDIIAGLGPAREGERVVGPDGDDAPNRVVFELQRDLNKRLDKYLTDRIPFMSRSQLQRLIDEGGVTVNARTPKASTLLRKGDRVEVFVPPPPSSEVLPEDIPLHVLYEDDFLIVLNKQADIIVHPARSHNKGTMINALAHHFKHRTGGGLSKVGQEFARPGVVHRLDRNTTGVIVFAKNDEAHWKLGLQFEHRRVDKRYVAVTHGHVHPPIDSIDFPIGPHPSREKGYREKYVVRHDELGKPSLTICRVMAHLGSAAALSAPRTLSIVELELKTGRTHQIRVHLSHLGFPIVGDDMYGGRPIQFSEAAPAFARQALHAAMLRFEHPITAEPMMFTAPLPADLRALIASIGQQHAATRFSPPGLTLSLERLLNESIR